MAILGVIRAVICQDEAGSIWQKCLQSTMFVQFLSTRVPNTNSLEKEQFLLSHGVLNELFIVHLF